MNDAATSRQTALAWLLPVLIILGLGGMAMGPAAPSATTARDIVQDAVAQRMAGFAFQDARRWQAEQGDLTIPWNDAHGHMAIVIDDVGRKLETETQLAALRFQLTMSVLPGSVYAAGMQARLAQDPRRYREVWLHLPMEPQDPAQMTHAPEGDEEFLLAADDDETLRAKLSRALMQVPSAVGVNNHMGSSLTMDRRAMDVVMDELAKRKLAFLDSRTTPETQAEAAARARGLPVASRQFFLDHEPGQEAIARQLRLAAERSESGPVVVIGHPSADVLEVLEEQLPALHARGVAVYPLSEIIAHLEP